MISAEIVADSINEMGDRITTFVLTFPRIVLAEFNTHRMLSRNSASSRAIPFNKMLEMVEENPFIPIRWMKEHKGMQGTTYFEGEEANHLREEWLASRRSAVNAAKLLSGRGLTKQMCNRLLEPFLWHKVIVTGTEWENFFALRAHPDAEIHIQDLAEKMLVEYNLSDPKKLKAGQWHIPFGDKIDDHRLVETDAFGNATEGMALGASGDTEYYLSPFRRKVATARCARISYNTFEGKDDYGADIALYLRLLESGHMSPFEHCARAMTHVEHSNCIRGERWMNGTVSMIDADAHGWLGNFRGWVQYRKTIEGENKKDNRIIKAK